jgi:hypothetical protein
VRNADRILFLKVKKDKYNVGGKTENKPLTGFNLLRIESISELL